jgi:hypothetical protein
MHDAQLRPFDDEWSRRQHGSKYLCLVIGQPQFWPHPVVLHDNPGRIGQDQNLCHNGVYKGTTLAQVAMNHPEYVRQLMTRAQRPEVRAAAGRLVEALEAAAEHKRKPTRGASRRGRSTT